MTGPLHFFATADEIGLPGSIDRTFDVTQGKTVLGFSGLGVPGITSLLEQKDGKIIALGTFTGVNEEPRRYMARLMPDGQTDPSFDIGLGFDGPVTGGLMLPDDSFIIWGSFFHFDGRPVLPFLKFDPRNVLDPAFRPEIPVGTIQSLAATHDGKILALTSSHQLYRLLSNGQKDPEFQPWTGDQWTPIQAAPDGSVLLVWPLLRLKPNGEVDSTFNCTLFRPPVAIRGAAPDRDGTILVGGSLHYADYRLPTRIERLNPDGTEAPDFHSDLNFEVRGLLILPDGRILARTEWQAFILDPRGKILSSKSAPYLAGLLPSGRAFETRARGPERLLSVTNLIDGIEPSFQTLIHPGGARVAQVYAYQNGMVLAHGGFWTLHGILTYDTVRLSPTGARDESFYKNEVSGGRSLLLRDDSILFVGSFRAFGEFGGFFNENIALIFPDGPQMVGFDPDIPQHNIIACALEDMDGKLLLGGRMDGFTGVHRILRSSFPDPEFSSPVIFLAENGKEAVWTLAVQPDGKILAGGNFYQHPSLGFTNDLVLRLNPNGSPDPTFRTDFEGTALYSLAVLSGGKILAAGDFTAVDGIPRRNLARLNSNGSLDPTFNPIGVPSVSASALLLQPDGKVLVGGSGRSYVGANSLVRLLPSGALDPDFFVVTGPVSGLDLERDGQILLAGSYSVNGVPMDGGLARLHNDLFSPYGTVRREISGTSVRLVANPTPAVKHYSIEESLPLAPTQMSHGASYDSQSAKLRFGPFSDGESRVFTYTLQTETNLCREPISLRGSCIVNVTNIVSIAGDSTAGMTQFFPADIFPANGLLSFDEAMNYGDVWRGASLWPTDGLLVSIDLATRGLALSQQGPGYVFISESNTLSPAFQWRPKTGGPDCGALPDPLPTGTATRTITPVDSSTRRVTVSVTLSPAPAVAACALEETIPSGWRALTADSDGTIRTDQRSIRWGPFAGAAERIVTYALEADPQAATGSLLKGTGCFDGYTVLVQGSGSLHGACRLTVRFEESSRLELTLISDPGVAYEIQTSTDLDRWMPLMHVTNVLGEFRQPLDLDGFRRFYRAQEITSD